MTNALRRPLVIGTRGSQLAQVQARHVAAQLHALGYASRLQILRTQGDKITDKAFTQMQGKGFFTKEIEMALQAQQIDLAVHSLKDLPTEAVADLQVVAIPAREDVRDCLVISPSAWQPAAPTLPLRDGATLGTSAVRRIAQLQALRPDVRVSAVRGNVPTRLRRLWEGQFDALLLAQAGLNRLQLDLRGCLAVPLDATLFVPAPGQGALALQARQDAVAVQRAVAPLHDAAAAECVNAERQLLARVEGGCHAPLGAWAYRTVHGMQLHVFYQQALGQPAASPPPIRLQLCDSDVASLVQRAVAALQAAGVTLPPQA